MTDELIYSWLCRAEYYPEYVKVIRDRFTGESKGYGFIRFPSMEYSVNFMDQHFPEIVIEGSRLSLEFGLHDPGDQQWACGRCQFGNYARRDTCFRCTADRPGGNTIGVGMNPPEEINDGTRDIGAEAHFLLLLRHLPLQADEEVIADAARYLGKAKRIHLVRRTRNQRSLGFAFIEYLGPIGANKALVLSADKSSHPEGFRVCGRPVGISFAHTSSFLPMSEKEQRLAEDKKKEPLVNNRSVQFLDRKGKPTQEPRQYWDVNTYISTAWVSRGAREPEEGEVSSKESGRENCVKGEGEEGKKRMKMTGKVSKSPVAMVGLSGPIDHTMAAPLSILPSTNWEKPASEGQKVEKGKEANEADKSTKDPSPSAATPPPALGITPSFVSRRMQNQLQFWNRQHEELKSTPQFIRSSDEEGSKISASGFIPSSVNSDPIGEGQGREDKAAGEKELLVESKDTLESSSSPPRASAPMIPVSSSPAPLDEDSYADLAQLACLLCQRAFKSEETLRKHEGQSSLHRDNLQDSSKVKEARIRLALSLPDEARLAGGKYRDRAAERRLIHGQPDKPPAPEVSLGYQQMRESMEEANRWKAIQAARQVMLHGSTGEEGNETGDGSGGLVKAIPEGNKGSQLLRKMGWKEGQGLGRDGDGIVKPLEAESYGKGVGLGAGLKRKANGQR
ncbi:hypothetical protein BJ684DRAFT_17785 [Piptocephalis cylindrospora]|uniref:G-patch domain-containing protein n=1 Tax=Piptocephalis cylindrospora TaxID=1907219 RepID=A0A4P9XZ23_9FUNG|nr:hypothetical protein BJ684DRAFT_17785 [Piptocephalis cylindrospora]|eukprot:RKP11644.1 hypothetical protein BJ684DRAFT_17785 [Piptocephalis cylindrospora]